MVFKRRNGSNIPVPVRNNTSNNNDAFVCVNDPPDHNPTNEYIGGEELSSTSNNSSVTRNMTGTIESDSKEALKGLAQKLLYVFMRLFST